MESFSSEVHIKNLAKNVVVSERLNIHQGINGISWSKSREIENGVVPVHGKYMIAEVGVDNEMDKMYPSSLNNSTNVC